MSMKIQIFSTTEAKTLALDALRGEFSTLNISINISLLSVDKTSEAALEALEKNSDAIFVFFFEDIEFDTVLNFPLKKFGKGAILIGDGDNIAALRRAQEAGALDYIPTKDVSVALMDTIQRQVQSKMSGSKIIAFMGVGGGAGSSTLASHFAEFCATDLNKNVALIDFDTTFGRLAVDYSAIFKSGFSTDYLHSAGSENALEPYFSNVRRNFDVYGHPNLIDLADSQPFENAGSFLNILRHRYDALVIDVPTRLSNFDPDILSFVDTLNLVFADDLNGIRNVANVMRWLNSSNLVLYHLIMNRRRAKPNLSVSEVSKILNDQDLTVFGSNQCLSTNQMRNDPQKRVHVKLPSSVRNSFKTLAGVNSLLAVKAASPNSSVLYKISRLVRHAN